MAKMRLYYSPSSPYARKVRVLALETGLDKKIDMVNVALTPVAAFAAGYGPFGLNAGSEVVAESVQQSDAVALTAVDDAMNVVDPTPVTPNTAMTPKTANTPATPVTAITPNTANTPNTPMTALTPNTPNTPNTANTPVSPVTPKSPLSPRSAVSPKSPGSPKSPASA